MTKRIQMNLKNGRALPYRDYFVLMDVSSSNASRQTGLRYLLQQFILTVAQPLDVRQDIYLTVVLFNHGFRILIDHARLKTLDIKTYSRRVDGIRFGGATDPVRPLAWALDAGLREVSVRRAAYGNGAVLPPVYLFWGDGKPDMGVPVSADGRSYDPGLQKTLEREFGELADRIKSLTRSKQILFFAYGFDTSEDKADRRCLRMLCDAPRFITAGLPDSAFVLPASLPENIPACVPCPHREFARRMLSGSGSDRADK